MKMLVITGLSGMMVKYQRSKANTFCSLMWLVPKTELAMQWLIEKSRLQASVWLIVVNLCWSTVCGWLAMAHQFLSPSCTSPVMVYTCTSYDIDIISSSFFLISKLYYNILASRSENHYYW